MRVMKAVKKFALLVKNDPILKMALVAAMAAVLVAAKQILPTESKEVDGGVV